MMGVVVAAIAFLLSGLLLHPLTRHADHLSLDVGEWFQENRYPRACVLLALTLGQGLAWLPAFAVGLYVFFRYSNKIVRDSFTRCAKCGYILSGLGRLRCPKCGKEV